ncbi:nicotinate-nucleotide--dimethylbenzimidazole phosphoribosyltransferase [Thermanaeromonas toyohensis]|nr:nicotinate-nucleotide--dimethylbenzimidazole phosphoribosyltransferase [Thermanaeromonas toyohensis]
MSLLAQTLKYINPVEQEIQAVVQKRLDNLTKPPGAWEYWKI